MDLSVFFIGVILFLSCACYLIVSLLKKKSLVIPFIGMGIGVTLCFVGLLLASPNTYDPSQELDVSEATTNE